MQYSGRHLLSAVYLYVHCSGVQTSEVLDRFLISRFKHLLGRLLPRFSGAIGLASSESGFQEISRHLTPSGILRI